MKAGDRVIFSGTRMDLQRLGLNKNNIDINLKKVQIVESIGPGNFGPKTMRLWDSYNQFIPGIFDLAKEKDFKIELKFFVEGNSQKAKYVDVYVDAYTRREAIQKADKVGAEKILKLAILSEEVLGSPIKYIYKISDYRGV